MIEQRNANKKRLKVETRESQYVNFSTAWTGRWLAVWLQTLHKLCRYDIHYGVDWTGLLMQTNAAIPTRWSVLGVQGPTLGTRTINFSFYMSSSSSLLCEVVSAVVKPLNFFFTVSVPNRKWREGEPVCCLLSLVSAMRRISEVWLLSAIIRSVQGELTPPSQLRPPCQAGLAARHPQFSWMHSKILQVQIFPRTGQTQTSVELCVTLWHIVSIFDKLAPDIWACVWLPADIVEFGK